MGKKKNDPPKQVILTQKEIDELLLRIHERKLIPEDVRTLESMFATMNWIEQRLSRARLSVKRLKKLFGLTSTDDTGKQ